MKTVFLRIIYGLWSIVHWTIKTAVDCVTLVVLLIGKVVSLIGSAIFVLLTDGTCDFATFKVKLGQLNKDVNVVSNVGYKAYIDMLYPNEEEES
jgi:hypothetical protein